MIQTSIIFSSRNRTKELVFSLPTLLTKYKDREDIEILAMDDHSTDGSYELMEKLATDLGWKRGPGERFRLFRSVRKTAQYDFTQSEVTNALVNFARGKYIILESSEVGHADDGLVDTLVKYCGPKQVSFATVYDTPGELIKRLELPGRKYQPPYLHDTPVHNPPEAVIFDADSCREMMHGFPLPRIILGDGESLIFREYCGPRRPVSLFFCGAILKDDWLALGGYDNAIPSDLFYQPDHVIHATLREKGTDILFWKKMCAAGFRFVFTSKVAVHITHGKS